MKWETFLGDSTHRGLISVKVLAAAPAPLLAAALEKIRELALVEKTSSVYRTLLHGASPKGAHDLKIHRDVIGLTLALKVLWSQETLQLDEKLKKFSAELTSDTLRREVIVKLLAQEGAGVLRPQLTLPDPEFHLHADELGPAVEAWPEFIHPVLEKSLADLNTLKSQTKWGEFYAPAQSLLDFSGSGQ